MSMGILAAILAALLFGISTPLAKLLLDGVQPMMLAGILYAGSGFGLLAALVVRYLSWPERRSSIAWPRGSDIAWLAGATLTGGVLGPTFLMFGLARTNATAASLLLNLEGVFTAMLAWFLFKENFDRRIALGMGCIVAGGIALAWVRGSVSFTLPVGSVLIAAACLCWAIDNNLTRRVSANDAMMIACLKGLVAGAISLGIARASGVPVPPLWTTAAAASVGFVGYGVSLVLFVVALRFLGSARTGAYFSLAPFFGAAVAIPIAGGSFTAQLAVAGLLMAAGTWLHISERHVHQHSHEPTEHTHPHTHDDHHQHGHAGEGPAGEPHTHRHVHSPLVHSHPHYPDIHHRHSH